MTTFNTASISPVQILGNDFQTPAGEGNPLSVTLGTGSFTATISSVSLGNSTASIGNVTATLAGGGTATLGRVDFAPSAAVLSSVPLSFSAPGTSTIVTGVVAQTINVYRMLATVSTATLLTFRNGTSLLTGDMSLGANGSIVLDYSGEPWFTCNASSSFNISLSTTSQLSGRLYYTQT